MFKTPQERQAQRAAHDDQSPLLELKKHNWTKGVLKALASDASVSNFVCLVGDAIYWS